MYNIIHYFKMTTLKQYIVKETDLLKKLCDIVQKDEIKAKLSVIYVDKKVNFDLSKDTKNDIKEEEVVTNFNLNEENNSLPSWVQAVMENEQ